MLLQKFAQFIDYLDRYLGEMLPFDITLWLGGLIVVIFVLAVWRMVH